MYNVIGSVILTFDQIFRSIVFLSYRADPITSRSVGVIPTFKALKELSTNQDPLIKPAEKDKYKDKDAVV